MCSGLVVREQGRRVGVVVERDELGRVGADHQCGRVFAPLERFVDDPVTAAERGEAETRLKRHLAATRFGMWVLASGMRHRLWRRAWRKLTPGAQGEGHR